MELATRRMEAATNDAVEVAFKRPACVAGGMITSSLLVLMMLGGTTNSGQVLPFVPAKETVATYASVQPPVVGLRGGASAAAKSPPELGEDDDGESEAYPVVSRFSTAASSRGHGMEEVEDMYEESDADDNGNKEYEAGDPYGVDKGTKDQADENEEAEDNDDEAEVEGTNDEDEGDDENVATEKTNTAYERDEVQDEDEQDLGPAKEGKTEVEDISDNASQDGESSKASEAGTIEATEGKEPDAPNSEDSVSDGSKDSTQDGETADTSNAGAESSDTKGEGDAVKNEGKSDQVPDKSSDAGQEDASSKATEAGALEAADATELDVPNNEDSFPDRSKDSRQEGETEDISNAGVESSDTEGMGDAVIKEIVVADKLDKAEDASKDAGQEDVSSKALLSGAIKMRDAEKLDAPNNDDSLSDGSNDLTQEGEAANTSHTGADTSDTERKGDSTNNEAFAAHGSDTATPESETTDSKIGMAEATRAGEGKVVAPNKDDSVVDESEDARQEMDTVEVSKAGQAKETKATEGEADARNKQISNAEESDNSQREDEIAFALKAGGAATRDAAGSRVAGFDVEDSDDVRQEGEASGAFEAGAKVVTQDDEKDGSEPSDDVREGSPSLDASEAVATEAMGAAVAEADAPHLADSDEQVSNTAIPKQDDGSDELVITSEAADKGASLDPAIVAGDAASDGVVASGDAADGAIKKAGSHSSETEIGDPDVDGGSSLGSEQPVPDSAALNAEGSSVQTQPGPTASAVTAAGIWAGESDAAEAAVAASDSSEVVETSETEGAGVAADADAETGALPGADDAGELAQSNDVTGDGAAAEDGGLQSPPAGGGANDLTDAVTAVYADAPNDSPVQEVVESLQSFGGGSLTSEGENAAAHGMAVLSTQEPSAALESTGLAPFHGDDD